MTQPCWTSSCHEVHMLMSSPSKRICMHDAACIYGVIHYRLILLLPMYVLYKCLQLWISNLSHVASVSDVIASHFVLELGIHGATADHTPTGGCLSGRLWCLDCRMTGHPRWWREWVAVTQLLIWWRSCWRTVRSDRKRQQGGNKRCSIQVEWSMERVGLAFEHGVGVILSQ